MVAGVGAVVAAGALLGLVAGAFYLRARGQATGFGFSTFQVELSWVGTLGVSGSVDLARGPSPHTSLLRRKMMPRTTSPPGRKGTAQP